MVTLCALLELQPKHMLESAEMACVVLPVVLSSLFGGRFQMTLESLKVDSCIRKEVQETVKKHLGGYLA